ncbi:probable serine/threonine-protein kinase PBL28 [Cynara cardunculus var. scolymus]|uniref:probable serine/threonine-protein kinase PBL28 n=1 Tax=Cynara cardunculus var. scolymus TaxID=59895 RepID=UPI000D6283B1|nr:probable serine/threonine-protein kinase PBL28 [Cynara cardunculus var. scolymus]
MQRLKICLGVARGLNYLHDPAGTQQRVLHRDIKSANILLDENWNAKISDLGLSKIGLANQKHTFLVSNVVGTFGYIDPLYLEMGVLTKESDIYSLGVVLFEKTRGARPLMVDVVVKLEIALKSQEIYEGVKLSEEYEVIKLLEEYEAIIKSATPSLIFRSKAELQALLSKGIIVNVGKTVNGHLGCGALVKAQGM